MSEPRRTIGKRGGVALLRTKLQSGNESEASAAVEQIKKLLLEVDGNYTKAVTTMGNSRQSARLLARLVKQNETLKAFVDEKWPNHSKGGRPWPPRPTTDLPAQQSVEA